MYDWLYWLNFASYSSDKGVKGWGEVGGVNGWGVGDKLYLSMGLFGVSMSLRSATSLEGLRDISLTQS